MVKAEHKLVKKPKIHSSTLETLTLAEKIKRNALKAKLAGKTSSISEAPSITEETSEIEVSLDKKSFTTFLELALIPELLETIQALKYTKPTPIQAEAIPHALAGKDIIGLAVTGSGKTAAFAIPVLQSLWNDQTPYYCLVISPTRELAYQIKETFDALGSVMGLRTCCIVGGMSPMDQALDLLRKPHIIVATPGRIIDHLEKTKGFSLRNLKYLVMDEADRLLEQEFDRELDKILRVIPRERNTYLFSATMTSKIEKLQRASLRNPVRIAVSSKYATAENLVQLMMLVSEVHKNTVLVHLLNEFMGKSIIIFTRTCAHAQRTALLARILGFAAVPLHGQLSQTQRLGSLNKFKSNQSNILLATDVAARGLDIPSVDVVINYDIPMDSKAYIHRVGRTARAGRSGKSISLVTQYDLEIFMRIEKVLGIKLSKDPLPSQEELALLHTHVDRAVVEAVKQTKDFHDKKGKKGRLRDDDDREER